MLVMKVSDYKRHAHECRTMAVNIISPLHRKLLLQMAETWDMLADERAVQQRRQPDHLAS